MAQTCRVCAHKKTKDIETDIVQRMPHTRIAKKYGIHFQSVRYHAEHHLPTKLVKSVQRKDQEHADLLFGNIQHALDTSNEILKEARDNKQNRLSLDAIKVILSGNELVGKMLVKAKEFESDDREEENNLLQQQVMKGLEALTIRELKVYNQLQAKIYSASVNRDYELSPEVRMFVESVNRMNGYDAQQTDNQLDNLKEYKDSNDFESESPRNRSSKPKNTQKQGSNASDDDLDLELDDLNLDDLNLDDLEDETIIPSEKTDPEWLREERRRRRLRNR